MANLLSALAAETVWQAETAANTPADKPPAAPCPTCGNCFLWLPVGQPDATPRCWDCEPPPVRAVAGATVMPVTLTDGSTAFVDAKAERAKHQRRMAGDGRHGGWQAGENPDTEDAR